MAFLIRKQFGRVPRQRFATARAGLSVAIFFSSANSIRQKKDIHYYPSRASPGLKICQPKKAFNINQINSLQNIIFALGN